MAFGLFKNLFQKPVEVDKSEKLESDEIKFIPYETWVFQTLSNQLERANHIKEWGMDECEGGCNRTSCTWCPHHKELIEAQAQIERCKNDFNVLIAKSLWLR